MLHLQVPVGGVDDTFACIADAVVCAFQVLYEKVSGSRWRLDGGVCHHVEYALVPVVSDSRDDRYGEVCHVFSQRQRICRGQR